MKTLQELREERSKKIADADALYNKAKSETRDLTDEESEQFDNLMGEAESLAEEIGKLEVAEERAERLNTAKEQATRSKGRKTQAGDPGKTSIRMGDSPEDKEYRTFGFKSLGEFAHSVARGSQRGIVPDDRFAEMRVARARAEQREAPSNYLQESVGADGGFAIPPDFRVEIMQKYDEIDSLVARTDQMNTRGNQVTGLSFDAAPWETDADKDIVPLPTPEGGLKPQSRIAIDTWDVKLNKITALVKVSDELLEDAPAIESLIRSRVPLKFDYETANQILRGTGVGQALGIFNSGALITVPKESGQSADSVVWQNIVKMWGRMPAGRRSRAVWLVSPEVEASLPLMGFEGTATGTPLYLGPNGLSGSPFGTLLGRPVIAHEMMNQLGDKGDILLADLSQYLTVIKGGLQAATSIHLHFDYDITTFRFVLRFGGRPWWSTPMQPRVGSNTYSPFVTLAERA